MGESKKNLATEVSYQIFSVSMHCLYLGSVGEVSTRACYFEEQQAREDETDERANGRTSQSKNCLNCISGR